MTNDTIKHDRMVVNELGQCNIVYKNQYKQCNIKKNVGELVDMSDWNVAGEKNLAKYDLNN